MDLMQPPTVVSCNPALGNELIALQALGDTPGFLKKLGDGTYSIDTSVYLTSNQSISVSGDATGSGSTAITLTLANSGVTAGTYNNSATQVRPFTVDAKGRITGVSEAINITPPWSAITGTPTTLSGYGITNALPLSGGTVTGDLVSTSATTSTSTTTGAITAASLGITGAIFADTANAASKITVGQNFSISSISGYSNISLGNSANSDYGASSIEIPTNTLYGGAFSHHTGVKLVCGEMEMVGWGTAKFKIHTSTDWTTYNTTPCFSVGDAGGTFLGSVKATSFFVGTNQVVSSRKTGWSAPTGTATRTTFATSTVTLSQLAETVKALIDDLSTHHGLIGS